MGGITKYGVVLNTGYSQQAAWTGGEYVPRCTNARLKLKKDKFLIDDVSSSMSCITR